MEQKKFITCGMQFGDEGKGSFVDYLTYGQRNPCIIRYNGGSQGNHVVMTPDNVVHHYSQLGSGMCNPRCYTFITSNMVINPITIIKEAQALASTSAHLTVEGILSRVRISGECYIVTPYHQLLGRLKELSLGENSRGTVGTGESEVIPLLNEVNENHPNIPLGIQMDDLIDSFRRIKRNLGDIRDYVSNFYTKYENTIRKNCSDEVSKQLDQHLSILQPEGFTNVLKSYRKLITDRYNLASCIYYDSLEFMEMQSSRIIFEGSQGLLIDKDFGLRPNVTHVDATTDCADTLIGYTSNLTKVGIAKAFVSRHGKGVFPTFDEYISTKIVDTTHEDNIWRGSPIRFGWFDCVLLKYAQLINQVDELYLSSLDSLDSFDEIKICDAYVYNGTVDNKFKHTFDYYMAENGGVYITAISNTSLNLTHYLSKCVPHYITVQGWKTSTKDCKKYDELPENLKSYLHTIEEKVGLPITIVSVGPTRENKICI